MTDRPSLLILASAATLTLALAQPVAADEAAMPAAAPAPAAEAPVAEAPAAAAPEAAPAAEAPAPTAAPEAAAAEPTPASDTAKQRMEEHRAKMNAERNRRYAELRQRASEVGIELPETPPWDQVEMPEMPEMPAGMGERMSPADMQAAREAHYQAMREHAKELGIDLPETPPAKLMTAAERRAKMEQMRNMTPEERMAARAENYKQLRERAAAQGIDLPETPPWEQAMQRRKAMQEKWEAYRKEVDAMTEEQREAAKAVFGASPMADAPQMPMQPQMPPMDMPMQPQMPPMDMPMQRQMPPMDMPMRRQMPPMDMPMRGQGPCPQGDCGGMAPPSGMMPGWNGNQGGGQMPPQPQGGYGAPWGRGY